MYKYKQRKMLALCIAGLCTTSTISTVYHANALAAEAAAETIVSAAAEGTGSGNASSAESQGNPPEKPDGDNTNPPGDGSNPPKNSGEKPGNPPEKPDGSQETPPEKPDGDSKNPPSDGGNPQGSDGKTGNPPGDGNGKQGNPPDGQPGDENWQPGNPPDGQPGGANTQSYDYSGTLSAKLTADGEEVSSDSETITSSAADENAALAKSGGTLKITNGTLQKSGDDTNGDNCNFYGINSILLAVGDGSAAYISDSSLTSDSEGSNAIFATDQATVYAQKDSIITSQGNSRGLDATYGGTIIANEMTIQTAGDHSAGIATDRGGGNISAANSSLHTTGSGSPLLYSTGAIEVDNVSGTAEGSQIAGMEGLNQILIFNSDLSSTMTEKTASDPVANGVIIYQSTSGDADTSTGETALFQAVDSTLSSDIESGAMFYLTNTTANVVLSGTTLNFDSEKAKLLQIEGNDANNWGRAGSNGAQVSFTGLGETLKGDISVDSISSLDLYLLSGTTYTGQITSTANAADEDAGDAPITVNIDQDSTWVVTGDTTVFALNAEEGARIVDENGKTVTIVSNGETIVKGSSDYTVTVSGSYSATVSTSEKNEVTAELIDRSGFDDYYGTTTVFGSNQAAADTEESEAAAAAETEAAETTQSAEAAAATSSQQSSSTLLISGILIVALLAFVGFYLRKRG